MNIRELFGFQGRVSRATYIIAGILGVPLKFWALDKILAEKLLHQSWEWTDYLVPVSLLGSKSPLSNDARRFLLILALTAHSFYLGRACNDCETSCATPDCQSVLPFSFSLRS